MRETNGGLIAFVCVTCTAFAAHQYLGGRNVVPSVVPPSPAVVSLPPLEVIEKAAEELIQLAGTDDQESAAERATALVDEVNRSYGPGVQDPELDETELSQLRIAALHAKYAAARLDPGQFADPFQEFAGGLIADRPNSSEGAHAALLQMLVKHDLRRPPSEDVFSDLEEYAATYSLTQGATLFCAVAQELARNSQLKSAEAVLRHGIVLYQSTPAAGTLVNKLADLKPREKRNSAYTRPDYKEMLRARQVLAAARRRANRNSNTRAQSTKVDCPPSAPT